MSMPIGRVKFFNEAFWGMIVCEDGRDIFFLGREVLDGEELKRNQWVSFFESAHKGEPCAVNVIPIDCPPEYLCHGVVSWFDADKKFGFILYDDKNGARCRTFFHASDVLLTEDGLEQLPAKGCMVRFHIGQKSSRDQAVNVEVTNWPEPEQTIEEMFLAAEELPVNFPEAKPTVEPQSVLGPETKNIPLIEIIRQRMKK
jgi:cold shock CspA family protein